MKKRLPGHFTPFVELPRRRRRDLYVSLRWKISRHTCIYGGKFTSRLALTEPGRPKLYNQWFHFCFLGNDGITIWNAYIYTAVSKFWNETHALAFNRTFSLLTEEQQELEDYWPMFGKPFFKDGKKCYTMIERKRQTYDCFGGLTSDDYRKKSEFEIIENEPPAIYESFRIHRNFRYGIGLNAVISAEEIDRDVIETTIERFRQLGETDWQSQYPVPRGNLPVETEATALSKVEYPSFLLGLAHRA